jgi:hypothetical protein
VLSPSEWVELSNGRTIRSESFASGFVGNGFRLDQGVSEAGHTTFEVDNIWVRGRMHVYELLIHQIRATNGSIFVSNTGKVTAVSGSGPYTLTTDPEHGFAVGDLIRAQRFTGTGVYQCNMQVTSVTSSKVFIATLSSGNAPEAGMDFVRLGSATNANRRGGLYLTADDSGAPFMDVFDGVSSFGAWGTAGVIKARLGKLDGLGLPGSYTNEYGLYAGDGTTDADAYIRLSNKTNRLNNLPLEWWTGGTRFAWANTTEGFGTLVGSAYMDSRAYSFSSPLGVFGGMRAYYGTTGQEVGVFNTSSDKDAITRLSASSDLTAGSASSVVSLTAQMPYGFCGIDMYAYNGVAGTIIASIASAMYFELRGSTGEATFYGLDVVVGGALAVSGAGTFDALSVSGAGTFGDTLSAPTIVGTGTLFDIYHNGNRFFRNHPSSDSYLYVGVGRTADGYSTLMLFGGAAANAQMRRSPGNDGLFEIIQSGIGAIRLRAAGGGNVEVYTDGATRFRFSGTDFAVLSGGGAMSASYVDAGASFRRSGVAGGIYVPLATAGHLTDSGGVLWFGADRNAGTYHFDLDTFGIPAAATAVQVQLSAKWVTTGNTIYAAVYKYGTGVNDAAGIIRSTVSGIAADTSCIVPVAAGNLISVAIVGANATGCFMRIVGYFI